MSDSERVETIQRGCAMMLRRGLSSPVIVQPSNDVGGDEANLTLGQLVAMSDDQLAVIDPLAMNLVVAKGVPSLASLDLRHYQDIVDTWVLDLTRRCLPHWEPYFHEAPQDFKNDLRYFRLGMVCQYLELEVGIRYNPDQREAEGILYTNPSDLFLNGVLDRHEGTCGNMAALQVAIGWRMGWPVALACVGSHYILRFDDGQSVYNIEATQSGYGGFKSDPDEYLVEERHIPPIALSCGSELRALRPRETLGVFVGLRARHLLDVGRQAGREDMILASEPDWLLARSLLPTNRTIYRNQLAISALRGDTLFDPYEVGHPNTFAGCLSELRAAGFGGSQSPGTATTVSPTPHRSLPASVDQLFTHLGSKP